MLAIFLAYLVVLTYLLVTPRPQDLVGTDLKSYFRYFFWTYVDPVTHLLFFFVLGFLASLIPWRRSRITLLVLLMLYGALTEVVQMFIPERSAEWLDLGQDVLGLAGGMATASIFLEWWRGRRQPAEQPAAAQATSKDARP